MSTQTTVPPEWVPRRHEYGGIRQIRRDENRKLTFKGQDQDEEVKMVVRKHPLFLIRPALPTIGALILLATIVGLFIRLPEFAAVWLLLLGILGFFFLLAL